MTRYVTVITEFNVVKVSLSCSRSLLFSSSISFISRFRLTSISIPVVVCWVVSTIVSVQKTSLVVVLRAVGSAFIISAVSGTVVVGNVQSWGLY